MHTYNPLRIYPFLLLLLLLSGCTDWTVDRQRQVATYPTCSTCAIPLPPQVEIRNNLMSSALLDMATAAPVEEVADFFKTALPAEGWGVQEFSLYWGGADYQLEKAGIRFMLRIGRENEGTAQQQTVISLHPCQTQTGESLNCAP